MTKKTYFREGRIHRTDGEIEFDILTVDGIGLPLLPPIGNAPRNYPKQINNVINMETKPSDILLSTYPKSACIYGTWFDYIKEIEQAKKNNKNIYTVYYEKVKEDPVREIRAIATFLELKCSDDVIKDISENCLFKNLKKAYEETKEFPPEFQKIIKDLKEKSPDFQVVNIFRKGTVGDWKNYFTVAQNEQFNALYKKEMIGIEIDVTLD